MARQASYLVVFRLEREWQLLTVKVLGIGYAYYYFSISVTKSQWFYDILAQLQDN